MDRPLRIGVIGCGSQGLNHLRAIQELGAEIAEVSAACDLSEERLHQAGKMWPAARLEQDYREALAPGDLDLVIVVTMPNTHATMCLAAFEAGAHVLCEKPLMMNLEEAEAVLEAAEAPTHDLEVLSGLLARIEVEDMDAERLRILRAALHRGDALPSRRIDQLRTMRDLLEARRNQFFAPIGWLLLWGTQLACALERWRAHSGATLGPWIDAAAEIEVLCALSGYAFEHPDDIFPELLDADPIFEGEALGHPLIPADDCVCNDLALGSERRALVMSGSNMSGKSTMLRTVGCAVILALAGAPVRAGRLRLSPLQIAASIRISDSLQQGASHFFAEITRLRQVVDLTEGEVPVLFLLDEVLHGTNSHDRRIGAEAVLRGLIDRGALGIVTTHDLALAEIADAEDLGLANVHFEDRIEAGRMFFDFRLRPGIVTRSKAIELMRSVGLDV